MSNAASKRHEGKRTWRHGPRFRLVDGGDGTWLVWDNAKRQYVAGRFTNRVRARAEVRSRNEAAGFGRVVNRTPPPHPLVPPVSTGPLREPSGRAVVLALVRAAPSPGSPHSASVVVRRPRRKGGIPPLGTKVTISTPTSTVTDAVVMSATPGGLGELVLLLEGVDPAEVPSDAQITWWA